MWVWPFNPAGGGKWCKAKDRESPSELGSARLALSEAVWGIQLSVCSISLLPRHILFLQGISPSIRRHQTCSDGWNPFNQPFVSNIFQSPSGKCHGNLIRKLRCCSVGSRRLTDRRVLEIMWHVSSYRVQSSSCHFTKLALTSCEC